MAKKIPPRFKIGLKIVLFLCGFVLLFLFFSRLLILKSGTSAAYATASGFRAEPRNSLDVVLVGSCHVHYNFSPGYLWKIYGIPAYNYSSGDQELEVSLLNIHEVFKRQNPELIVLDVYGATYADTYSSPEKISTYLQGNFDAHPISMQKLKTAYRFKDTANPLELAFGLLYHKSRFQSLTATDFSFLKDKISPTKGYYTLGSSTLQNKTVFNPSRSSNDVRGFEEEDVLKEIIDYVHSQGSDILLIASPYETSVDEFAFYNRVAEIAAEKEVSFLNFNQIQTYNDLDAIDSDFADAYHFNFRGVQKYTNYLGNYFTENYDFTDKRSDPNYSAWNEFTVPATQATMLANELKMENYSDAWLTMLNNPDFVLFLNTQDSQNRPVCDYLSEDDILALQALGIETDLSDSSIQSYQAILCDGKTVNEAVASLEEKYLANEWQFDEMYVTLESSSKNVEFASTKIGNAEYGTGRSGLTVAVYSKSLKKVVDSAAINDGSVNRKL
ncbi:MAG: hypothetical protein RRY96_00865 [Ruthenibacterium sp.]